MIAEPQRPSKASVLMVDDEAVSRKLIEYYLGKNGFTPVVASSAASARAIVAEKGPGTIDCVVTDYNMPEETGLELLFWLKQNDPTLSVIMVTATTERETVAATLRGGASDFLDKPITESELLAAVETGIATTSQRRRLAEADKAVKDVGKAQYRMFGLGTEGDSGIEVCFHPFHSAGGDFVNYFELGVKHFQVLTGDVSGHDLQAAYVSAYFQGMARGMIESGQALTRVLAKFNNLLLLDSGEAPDMHKIGRGHSLCACVVDVDLEKGTLAFCNYGIPATLSVGTNGIVSRSIGRIGSPLGWFEQIDFQLSEMSSVGAGSLYVWTDGLEDLATALGVSPCSLAARLVRARRGDLPLPNLNEAADDVLAVRIPLSLEERTNAWLPVINESYRCGTIAQIDTAQTRWQRSLEIAAPEVPETRVFDLLLATRETVINGLKYGCTSANGSCALSIAVDPHKHIVRVHFSDPGHGHDFDWAAHQKDPGLCDLHRGLALINRLATKVTSLRNGAELTLDFSY